MRTVLATLAALSLVAAGGTMLWSAAGHRADRAGMNRLLPFHPLRPRLCPDRASPERWRAKMSFGSS
jgi:hypothetical protein